PESRQTNVALRVRVACQHASSHQPGPSNKVKRAVDHVRGVARKRCFGQPERGLKLELILLVVPQLTEPGNGDSGGHNRGDTGELEHVPAIYLMHVRQPPTRARSVCRGTGTQPCNPYAVRRRHRSPRHWWRGSAKYR